MSSNITINVRSKLSGSRMGVWFRCAAVLWLFALSWILTTTDLEARRVALVIGNSAYKVGPLVNPRNDADAVATAFQGLGFDDVVLKKDLGTEAMRRELSAFGRLASGAEMAVVFFAGHGTEMAGRNYLIPVDARLERSADIELEAIGLDTVIAQIDGAKLLKLVILDACRNNIFPMAGAKRSLSRGLARVEPGGNTLVAYAAKEGTLADDGTGNRNSPFTTALLKNLTLPGVDIRLMFGGVRDDVLAATNGQQEPYLYGTAGRQAIYLKTSASQPPLPIDPEVTRKAAEEEFARRLEAERRRMAADFDAERKRLADAAIPAQPPKISQPKLPTKPDTAPSSQVRVWEPTKPVSIVVPAGTGGGADQMARLIQGIVAKHSLMRQPLVVINKAGGAGAEGMLEIKGSSGDPHRLMIAFSNFFTTPLATGIPVSWKDMTPVAMLALDQFILWVHSDSPYRSASDYLAGVRSAPDRRFKMGGTGSKQEDQILTAALERQTAPKKFTYIPYAGGGAVAVQLVGKHIDSSVSNPIEAVMHWRAGLLRPLCLFAAERSQYSRTITGSLGWNSIPTCRESGVDVTYQMMRSVFMPAGIKPEQIAYFIDLLQKVRATPDWQQYLEEAALKNTFLTGPELRQWVEQADAMHRELMVGEGLISPARQ